MAVRFTVRLSSSSAIERVDSFCFSSLRVLQGHRNQTGPRAKPLDHGAVIPLSNYFLVLYTKLGMYWLRVRGGGQKRRNYIGDFSCT